MTAPFLPLSSLELSTRSAVMLALLLAAGVTPSRLSAQPPAGIPGAPPVPVVTPDGAMGTPQPRDPNRTPQPIPETGTNEAFSFQKATDVEGTYMVYPAGGGEPVRVSESFLGLVMKSPQLDNQRRAQALQSYPSMVAKQYEAVTNEMYPDASSAGAAQDSPFQSQAIGTPGSPAGSATIEADPLAPGYLRVSLANPDGTVQEFSVARQGMERILANPAQSDLDKLQALRNFPFKLPEEARQNFKNMSREELLDAVAKSPEMQRQEFVKMVPFSPKAAAANTTPTRDTSEDMATTIVPGEVGPPRPVPTEAPEPTPSAVVRESGDREPVAEAIPPVVTTPQERGGLSLTAIAAIVIVVLGLLGALAVGLRKRQ